MYLGRIVELAENAVLYGEPMHPYTEALLSAVPIPDPVAEELRRAVVLQGQVPSPADPPSGCHFHTRCPAAVAGLCDVDDPVLHEVRPGHFAACHLVTESDFPHIRAGENGIAKVGAVSEVGERDAERVTEDSSLRQTRRSIRPPSRREVRLRTPPPSAGRPTPSSSNTARLGRKSGHGCGKTSSRLPVSS